MKLPPSDWQLCWFDLDMLKTTVEGDDDSSEGTELVLDGRDADDDSAVAFAQRVSSLSEDIHRVRRCSHHRRVRFDGTVQVHLTDLVLTDHPQCIQGFALECGWRRLDTELAALTQDSRRRHGEDLRVPVWERIQKLQAHTGLSKLELFWEDCTLRMNAHEEDGEALPEYGV